MIQWEYFDLWTAMHDGAPNLNLFGKDGWELVSVIYLAHTSTTVHYFKRPLSTAEKIFNEVKNEVEGITKSFSGQIIQSAFQFDNGKRVIIYTGGYGIRSFECDENWKPFEKPFAESDNWYGSSSDVEYHSKIRKLHKPEDFVEEHSTNINSFTQKQ